MRKLIGLSGIFLLLGSFVCVADDGFDISCTGQVSCTHAAVSAKKSAHDIHWQDYSQKIFMKAKASHHLILLFGMSATCHWCQKMETETFSDAALVKVINENYIPVLVDVHADKEIAKQYDMTRLPSNIVLDANGNIVKQVVGYTEANELMQDLQDLAKSNAS